MLSLLIALCLFEPYLDRPRPGWNWGLIWQSVRHSVNITSCLPIFLEMLWSELFVDMAPLRRLDCAWLPLSYTPLLSATKLCHLYSGAPAPFLTTALSARHIHLGPEQLIPLPSFTLLTNQAPQTRHRRLTKPTSIHPYRKAAPRHPARLLSCPSPSRPSRNSRQCCRAGLAGLGWIGRGCVCYVLMLGRAALLSVGWSAARTHLPCVQTAIHD
ncbi:hypothetical protein HDK77DRAFT_65674 [Phyllosticta capitalensis]|uniref:Uncharacterized protein n=1 Tax=Phyllosticta capitalensis TaxID=121624 RepID=A0ABR1YQV2_9PEZI